MLKKLCRRGLSDVVERALAMKTGGSSASDPNTAVVIRIVRGMDWGLGSAVICSTNVAPARSSTTFVASASYRHVQLYGARAILRTGLLRSVGPLLVRLYLGAVPVHECMYYTRVVALGSSYAVPGW